MIAKQVKATEAKAKKFMRGGARSNGRDTASVPVLLKIPSGLLEWLTLQAAEDGRTRSGYIMRVLEIHRNQVERGE